MNRRTFLAVALSAPFTDLAHATPLVRVYKSATCECCTEWAAHLRSNGFQVEVVNVAEPGQYRRRYGIPDVLGACHTGVVDGYAVEGHVPAKEIQRLLRERPKAVGLAVPAMPLGSPGMEYQGRRDPYDVLLVDRQGQYSVYASYR
jgi:hypothetical protein